MFPSRNVQISKDFSPILDAEDPIPEAYTLEVSSPGLDRILGSKEILNAF